MKLIIQRVSSASVTIDNKVKSQIDSGLLILFGAKEGDNESQLDWLVNKVVNLRIFSDSQDKMNLSVADIKGEILVVSQFTLYADCQKGNRPSFTGAAKPEVAQELYNLFVKKLQDLGIPTKTGEFGAKMDVSLTNDGPVTIILES
ncbi:D-tyrosyl-tRNA(Tyr) deacylase [Candidatus Beckwithbacteria bacterium]|nr:D-tyrosyl-tRNA(Tyr) deacylase [Candidatus Beckwithbacteria bacterium]